MSEVSLVNKGPSIVTNIGELFEALAIGWEEGSHKNRYVFGGEKVQFVCVSGEHIYPPHARIREGDIPIETLSYRMQGFIKFEAKYLFKGLFEARYSDYDDAGRAWLTPEGFRISKAGLIDFDFAHHRDFKHCEFFNPSVKAIAQDLMLMHRLVEIVDNTTGSAA